MEKKKKDRRIHASTVRLVAAALLVGIVVLTISYTYAWGDRMKSIEATSSSDVFVSYETKTLSGDTFTDEDVSGAKVIAYNVWETTCPACLSEMRALEELSRKFPLDEFLLVGVCADLYDRNGEIKPSQLETAQSLMKDAGASFSNIIPTEDMMSFFKSVIPGFPTTFFVDQNGKIIEAVSGSDSLKGWTQKVEELLSKEGV